MSSYTSSRLYVWKLPVTPGSDRRVARHRPPPVRYVDPVNAPPLDSAGFPPPAPAPPPASSTSMAPPTADAADAAAAADALPTGALLTLYRGTTSGCRGGGAAADADTRSRSCSRAITSCSATFSACPATSLMCEPSAGDGRRGEGWGRAVGGG